MEYRTIYEIGVGPINPMMLIIPAVFLLNGIITLIRFIRKKRADNFKPNEKKMFIAIMVGSVIMACFVSSDIIKGYNRAKDYYAEGNCLVKEGNVDALYEYRLFQGETMVVDGENFNYARADMDGGLFHSVKSDVHEGSTVRIYYRSKTSKTIYKLEVKE